jgi:hypothetical protein
MTSIKTLVAAGLLLAVTGAALADPVVKVLPAGSKGGSLIVQGIVNGGVITALELHLTFDNTKVSVANTSGSFVPNGAGGWATNGFNVIVTGTTSEIQWVVSNGNGQSTDGPIGSMTFTASKTSKVTMTTASNWSDADFNVYQPTANADSAVISGAVRDLGAPVLGAPSTGPGKVVAVVAGTSLQLLNAADLTSVAGFAPATVGPVSGRPAFGMAGSQAVIAVGDDAGKLTVVDAATGAPVAGLQLGTKVSTPAIAADGIYVAVSQASSATLVKVVGATASPVATLTGNTITGAPAVFGGLISVGTNAGVESFRADGTPQAGVADAAGATIAPIIGAGGKGLSANGTNLLFFNAVTGASTFTVAHGAGALSEAWYDAATDTVVFGTPSGKILSAGLSGGAPTLGAQLTPQSISCQPIVLGGVTYAIGSGGNLDSTAGLDAPLGAPGAKALAATGRATGDSLIAATTTGLVAALTL